MARGRIALLAAALPLLQSPIHAATLPIAKPVHVGFSSARLNQLDTFFQEKIDEGKIPGIVLLVSRHGKIVHFSALGYADVVSRKKMTKGTIFRLYSMTKPITATALMMLYDEGKFQLNDPISKYIPEFKGARVLCPAGTCQAIREPTIHDLLRHTAGLKHNPEEYERAQLFDLDIPLKEEVRRLAMLPLYHQPGTVWEYSIAPDVEARLVEVLSGKPFDRFIEGRLFTPLGMSDTSYFVPESKVGRFASVHHFDGNHYLVPCNPRTCNDPLNDIDSPTRVNVRTPGSFGLVATAEDYWRFAQMLANGGTLNGRRYLSANTVRYMTRDHLGPVRINDAAGEWLGTGWGLGFAIVDDEVAEGSLVPRGSFYWAGGGNTLFWIDPKNDIVVVALTQTTGPDVVGWHTLREQIAAFVYGALVQRTGKIW
jgi:CubicO group peptidase (beta-lactamase class C family)